MQNGNNIEQANTLARWLRIRLIRLRGSGM